MKVTSPLYFFSAANSPLNHLASELPLKSGEPFDLVRYGEGASQITTTVRTGFTDGLTAMRFVATVPRLENCTDHTVEVHYIVYTSVFPPLTGKSFEAGKAELNRPATTGALLGTEGRLFVVPEMGYNHTRNAYGGILVQSQMPLWIFDDVTIHSSASTNSVVSDAALTGSRNLGARYLNQAQWRTNWTYYDVPAGQERLQEAKLVASFFATTKELGQRGWLLKYGASLAGGHQQGPVQDSSNSPYGDLKLVAGVENRHGQNAFAGTYGFELGTTLNSQFVDFAKYIADLRYSRSFSPFPKYKKPPDQDDRKDFIGKDHKPFTLEARVNGGYIQAFGQVPGPARFFGGNQASAPFIEGQTWDIRDQPLIRSIPQNQLGSLPSESGVGGTRFYAFNLTVAKAVIGKALVPKDLGTQDFVDALDFAIKTGKGELADAYFGKDPTIAPAIAEVSKIKEQADDIKKELQGLSFDPATAIKVGPILKTLTSGSSLGSAQLVSTTADAILNHGKATETSILLNSQLPALESNLTKLCNLLATPAESTTADQIQKLRDELDESRKALAKSWVSQNTKPARERATAHAEKDFATAENVLNTFLYQLNVYSIAPVAIFDVARVWPNNIGTRYAVGGGVRLSIVNVNFTLGYAANPTHGPTEGSGALFFTLDVSDLFR